MKVLNKVGHIGFGIVIVIPLESAWPNGFFKKPLTKEDAPRSPPIMPNHNDTHLETTAQITSTLNANPAASTDSASAVTLLEPEKQNLFRDLPTQTALVGLEPQGLVLPTPEPKATASP